MKEALLVKNKETANEHQTQWDSSMKESRLTMTEQQMELKVRCDALEWNWRFFEKAITYLHVATGGLYSQSDWIKTAEAVLSLYEASITVMIPGCDENDQCSATGDCPAGTGCYHESLGNPCLGNCTVKLVKVVISDGKTIKKD